MEKEKGYPGSEQRHYIRLDSVFPVQFRLLSLDGKNHLSDWLQGFTDNIGKGGICLTANNLKPELAGLLESRQSKLSLEIEMPVIKSPVAAQAKVVWMRKAPGGNDRYLIGLSYEKIDPGHNVRIMRYAVAKKVFVPLVLVLIILLAAGFGINRFINIKLKQENQTLVGQLVRVLEESEAAKKKVQDIAKEAGLLQERIRTLESHISKAEQERARLEEKARLEEEAKLREKSSLEAKMKLEEAHANNKINEFDARLRSLIAEKKALGEQLAVLKDKESRMGEDLLRLDKRKAGLEKINFDNMYEWLKVHQNPRTGLVISFEGDDDIANWAFIYDQSLVIQAFTNGGDFGRAKKALDFFKIKAKRRENRFFNAYYTNSGEPAEYVVHSGPNIWLGIAVLQYINRTQDRSYVGFAEDIAQSIIAIQNQDREGGIRGGPGLGWYATEHNLDAYAFFNMLHKITGNPQYLKARDKVLDWLLRHTYDTLDIPIKRGKGDSTIATDTYAWSIAAIGPQKLEELKMNPDKMLEFAEQHCCVEIIYQRPDGGQVKVKGFDFAPQRHLARGGVVSPEWSAQMIMAFKIMSDFYAKKNMARESSFYGNKAVDYLFELNKMIISSPSPSGQGEGCLPYASQDSVDTGHGWMVPKGKSTGSVAGTAYTLFAYYNYNPLELKQ